MIGKKASEAQPIAKDETRVEEKVSGNGTTRQDLLDGLESTRNLFELMIFKPVHGCKLYGLSGGCAMQIECAIHGGGVSRGAASAEPGRKCARAWPRIHACT